MERRDDRFGDAQAAHEFVDALAHFSSGLVCERHRQDGFRHNPQIFDEMGNAVGNDTRLAATRTGKNQHRAFRSLHGFALLWVKLVEKRQCGSGSGVGT